MHLSLRLPSVYPKVKRKMDPIFEHPVFDSAREKVNVLQGSLKNHGKPLKTRCILASNVRATRYFLSRNRSGLVMSE